MIVYDTTKIQKRTLQAFLKHQGMHLRFTDNTVSLCWNDDVVKAVPAIRGEIMRCFSDAVEFYNSENFLLPRPYNIKKLYLVAKGSNIVASKDVIKFYDKEAGWRDIIENCTIRDVVFSDDVVSAAALFFKHTFYVTQSILKNAEIVDDYEDVLFFYNAETNHRFEINEKERLIILRSSYAGGVAKEISY